MEELKLVIIGHVDHGKSTLIGRLLFDTGSIPEEKIKEIKNVCEALGRELEFAYVMDALQEEREKQITIDTTQIFFKAHKKTFVIIDAPGHKEFLKNMISGASQADFAVLIVDVCEDVSEQTKRHSFIVKLLGIENLVVVINKMDLVGYNELTFSKVKENILNYLRNINLSPLCIIPISAKEGDNIVKKSSHMDWYTGLTLLEALEKFKPLKKEYEFRMAVQDVYKIDNITVAVGNIISGSIQKNDFVFILPDDKTAVVKNIFQFDKTTNHIKAPAAVGLELSTSVKRGDILCKGSKSKTANYVKAKIFCISNTIKKNETLVFRCATQRANCEIIQVNYKFDTTDLIKRVGDEIIECEVAEVLLKTDKPIAFEQFRNLNELGRFVLEREGEIVACGVIT